MVGLSITGHVNGLITASPDEALAAAAVSLPSAVA